MPAKKQVKVPYATYTVDFYENEIVATVEGLGKGLTVSKIQQSLRFVIEELDRQRRVVIQQQRIADAKKKELEDA